MVGSKANCKVTDISSIYREFDISGTRIIERLLYLGFKQIKTLCRDNANFDLSHGCLSKEVLTRSTLVYPVSASYFPKFFVNLVQG